MSKWPSRRLQIGAMIVLAIGAAVQVFMPPLTRHARAERLYLDGWFEESVPKLEQALKLDPGNSIYEQALVWHYPKSKLPDLLKKRRLGPDAKRLAAGVIYSNQIERTKDPRRKLVLVDDLIKADPSNALPHYRKASILHQMGRLDAAIREMREANKIGKIRLYTPGVPDSVLNSNASPDTYYMHMGDYSGWRKLVRGFENRSHAKLRDGKVEEAAGLMEDCCRMSVVVSTAEPPTIMAVLVGRAIQIITWSRLEPVCKDFGMKDRLSRMKRLDGAYERATQASRDEIGYGGFGLSLVIAIPFAIAWAAGSAAAFLIITVLLWILPAIRRRGQSAVSLTTWSEGWIARVSIFNVPFMAAALYFGTREYDMESAADQMGPYALLIVLGQIVILALGLRVLHHRYDQDAGERTGIFRFAIRSPAAVKAWIRRSLIVLLGGQIVFAVCLALLATILCKPILGGHPWQIQRYSLLSISHEEATMRRVGNDLRKAYSWKQTDTESR